MEIKFQLWDVAIESRVPIKQLLLGASAVVYVFDLVNEKTLEELPKVIELFKQNMPKIASILVGNKKDLEDCSSTKIDQLKVNNLIQKYSIPAFVKTSAKTGENIDQAFDNIAEQLCTRMLQEYPETFASEEPHCYKVVVIGSGGVGKTAIITRYTASIFNADTKLTIGAEFSIKSIHFDQNKIIDKSKKVQEMVAPSSEGEPEKPYDEDMIVHRNYNFPEGRMLKAKETEQPKKLLPRQTTVFYQKRMNPLTLNKLAVLVTTPELHDKLKIKIEGFQHADSENKKPFGIDENEPIVDIEPEFPNCVCVPSVVHLNALNEMAEARFLISPLATGNIPDACVKITYKGILIDKVKTPTKVVKTTAAKVNAIGGVVIPVIGKLVESFIGTFLSETISFYTQIGGFDGLLLILTGIEFLLSGIFYLFKKPKEATPIQKQYPPFERMIEQKAK